MDKNRSYEWHYEQMLFEFLNQASRLQAIIDKVCRIHAITVQQWHLLQFLKQAQPRGITVSGLGGLMHVTKGNITGILNRLEVQQMVKRVISENDRRVIDVIITGRGVQTLMAVTRSMRSLYEAHDDDDAPFLVPVVPADSDRVLKDLWTTLKNHPVPRVLTQARRKRQPS